MKKGFLPLMLTSLGMMLGFTSCKKDCIKCFTYTYSGNKARICNDQVTQTQYDTYLAQAKLSSTASTVREEELCSK